MAAQLLSTNNEPPTKIQATEEPLEKPTRPPPPSPVKNDYKLVWADEFDYEGLPHPKRWGYQVEANNWVHDRNHNEQQWYMASRRENSYVSGGTLKIIARREDWIGKPYTSARIRTRGKGDWVYGKLLVRAKLPAGKPGIWPAIWMMPTHSPYGGWAAGGEIDIVESRGNKVHETLGALHFGGKWPDNVHLDHTYRFPGKNAAEDFHVYAVEWSADEISWFVDGRKWKTRRKSEWWSASARKNPSAPYDQPFHLILNVAVDGRFFEKEDQKADRIPASQFPQVMQVDYVRVYQRNK